jgi:arylsulfatase A
MASCTACQRFARGFISLLVPLLVSGSSPAAQPPNIVLVIGDDHGWAYSGFMGDPFVQTPSLDRLAADGTVFTDVHVPAPICKPSLQTLLGGIHPLQWSAKEKAVEAVVGAIPRAQEVEHYRTLPRELQHLGYRSWEGGKMWEGAFEQAGFTHGLAHAPPGLWKIEGTDFGRRDWHPETCGPTAQVPFQCLALDPVREFLDEIEDAPFFLWFAPKLPHTPFDAAPEYRQPYLAMGLSRSEITYYAQVTWLDALIGELLGELDSRGLRDDTLVIYISDNGWEIGQGYFGNLGNGKGSLHELGSRTPLVFNWPGRVPPGVIRDDLAAAQDLFPTILDYAGAEQLPDRRGMSLRPTIETGVPFSREQVVSFFAGVEDIYTGFFVRTPEWRYMSFGDGHEELYRISVDPFEHDDLAALYPELLAAFREDAVAWGTEIETAPDRLEAAGQLVDDLGRAIAGASLELRGESTELKVLTDRHGRYRFQNLAHGDYTIRSGRRGRRASVVLHQKEIPISLPVGPTGLYLPEIVGAPGLVVDGGSSSSIAGIVSACPSRPIAGVDVTVRSRLGGRRRIEVVVRADDRGRYLAENLPPGRYRIRAELPRGFRPHSAKLDLAPDTRATQDLTVSSRCRRRGPMRPAFGR